MPFLSDAPAGRSTVSITEVAEMKTGSEISDLLTDFLRVPDFVRDVVLLLLKVVATGVDAADSGGVEFAENGAANGGTGEFCGRSAFNPGLGAPGDGLGDNGKPGEKPGFGLFAAGERRGEATGIGP